MKLAILLLIFAAGTQTTEELVEAAKEAKSKRKSPATKVLTNKDVKSAKGKLIILPGSEEPPPEKKTPALSPLQQQDADYRARLELGEAVAAAEKKVTALRKELEHLESRYYEENDPDRRDKVIRKRFDETQQKLKEAEGELQALHPEPHAPSPEP